jgi:5-methyltetrahydrofolate--homocysteine methyltransferase
MVMDTILKTNKNEVVIGANRPFVMIGEKINPSGFKKLGQALIEKNMKFIQQLALQQVTWGADVLDVNVGYPGIDQVEMMRRVVEAVQAVVDVPLCIDSNKAEVLEAGLRSAAGKPLANSVSGAESQMAGILPMVKERGAAVIGLTITEEGIPPTAEERLAVAGKIIERAVRLGIPMEDIMIDPLVMPIAHDSLSSTVTIQAIELIRKEYGVNICLGASNVSFGLMERHSVNAAFITYAMQSGVTCALTDPIKMGQIIHAADMVLGRDVNSVRFLKYARQAETLSTSEQS